MTLRIDRSRCDSYTVFCLDGALIRSANRRRRNAELGACINDSKRHDHGKATHGVRCFRCYLVHVFGAVVARTRDDYHAFVAVPITTQKGHNAATCAA